METAIYRTMMQKDGSYGVEITRRNAGPSTTTGFRTEAEAQAWLERKRDEDFRLLAYETMELARQRLRERGMTDAEIDAELARSQKRPDLGQRAKSIVDRVTGED